jgi:hypothetical protein
LEFEWFIVLGRSKVALGYEMGDPPSIPTMTACHIPTIPDQINE